MSVDYPSPWTGSVASVKGVGQPHPPPSVELPPSKVPKIEGLNKRTYSSYMYMTLIGVHEMHGQMHPN